MYFRDLQHCPITSTCIDDDQMIRVLLSREDLIHASPYSEACQINLKMFEEIAKEVR